MAGVAEPWWDAAGRDRCGTWTAAPDPWTTVPRPDRPLPDAIRPVPPRERRTARARLLLALHRRTRSAVVRAGLRHRAVAGDVRPTVPARRRRLAAATSMGLSAPIFVLDGLPSELGTPRPQAWDDLGPASVVVAAGAVRGLGDLPDPADLVGEQLATRRRATPWVRAAGVEGAGVATTSEIREAVSVLGVDPGPTLGATVVALRHGVYEQTRDTLRALGLAPTEGPVRAGDVVAAARALRVPAPQGATPQVSEAVVAAGRDVVAAHLEQAVTPYAVALGLDVGPDPDVGDTRAVAAELGVELPDVPDVVDAERLHHAWLQSLTPAFDQLGMRHGRSVDPVDLVALARALGADVGSGVGPASVRELTPALRQLATTPPVVGTIGGARLTLPSHDVLLAGWHEAAGPSALPMSPVANDATTQLPSRARGTHPSSALDVAVAPGTRALAPVTGTVVEATPYLLYGQYPDTRIVIRPDAAPDLAVAVLHVTGAQVAVGDHVTAGAPIADHATELPFPSQIERLSGRAPHIHIEVKPA